MTGRAGPAAASSSVVAGPGRPHAPLSRCPICGASLDGHRRDAVYCGGPCRTEASRIRRLLGGRTTDGYGTLRDYLGRAQRRTNALRSG